MLSLLVNRGAKAGIVAAMTKVDASRLPNRAGIEFITAQDQRLNMLKLNPSLHSVLGNR